MPGISPSDQDRAFASWLAVSDTVALTCRVQGHQWPGYDELGRDDRIRRRGGQYVLTMACRRGCGVIRKTYLTSDFYPAGKDYAPRNIYDYSHAKGYRLSEEEGGGWNFGRGRRAGVRRELIMRATGGEIQEAE